MVQNAAVAKIKAQVISKKENVTTIESLIEENKVKLGEILPANMSKDRLVRIALTTIRLNPKLADCTPQSFLGALFQSAQLGLEPNIEGQAYIIPYNNTKIINGRKQKVTEAQFQIGYKGYIELFYRHGAASYIDMHSVYQNDIFEYSYGTENYIKHCPKFKDRGEVIAYYAIAKLRNGGSLFKVMSKEECIEHGQTHSKCYIKMEWNEAAHAYVPLKNPYFEPNSPWAKDLNAMCKKTVIKQLAKILPKSVELQKAIAMDDTTKSIVKKDMFEVPDETNWNDDEVMKKNANAVPRSTLNGSSCGGLVAKTADLPPAGVEG